jgi:signal transduction histidine kinase/CheY-like chemotaxis protein
MDSSRSFISKGRHSHAVQFYESDNFLCETVGHFLGAGLRDGHLLIVIATPSHRELLKRLLTSQGFDVESEFRSGRFVMLDARETLATFMHGKVPNPSRFRSVIGDVIEKVREGRSGVPVSAFGEMVDLLWRDGNPDGALRLEELWNDLAATHSFSLLCAYAIENFSHVSASEQFQRICGEHSRVIPAEPYTQARDEDARLREISFLQHRAHALEAEIERRKELEKQLRDTLEVRERMESERQRLLDREKAARAEAESANRLKDEFLAVLSHELRTPLSAILGWTHVVDSRSDEQTIRRALDVVRRNAKLQLHLIDDLLDVSRVMSGKMVINNGPVDLAPLLQAAVESVRPSATAKAIRLDLHIAGSAPVIVGDADRLQQVIWNLLSNAIKFTPQGGRVELRLESDGSRVLIFVRDNGQGIDPEFLPHVFDRFRQEHTGTTRRYGGLGLGLAVVRYLTEAHGGTVVAESEGIGKGATFIVALPATQAIENNAEQTSSPEPSVALNNICALVVDDEKDTREMFAYVLECSGAEVRMAASVDEAMRVLPSRPFDILIADIGMPDRDGLELIATVRSHSSPRVHDICAIAVTSYVGDHYREHAISCGYDEYITKPMNPESLVQIVSDRVRGRCANAG